jgi:hypothetical protein
MFSALLSLLLGLSVPAVHAASPGLTVTAAPVSLSTVARGATRVPMLTLTLEASCAAEVPLRSITLYHEGLGQPRDLSAVYLQEGVKRVTRASVPAQRDGKITLRFRGFALKPCEERTLIVMTDLSAEANTGGRHMLALRAGTDIDAGDASVSVTSARAITQASAGATAQGTIDVSYLNLQRRVDYGSDRIIARIKLEADSESRHLIDAITFTNDGKARDADLRNLWIGSTRKERLSATLEQLDGDTARMIFEEPLLLDRNASVTLELHADVRASRSRTIRFEIQEASDIEARAVKGRILE